MYYNVLQKTSTLKLLFQLILKYSLQYLLSFSISATKYMKKKLSPYWASSHQTCYVFRKKNSFV